jgi:hypothetical protein
MKFHMKELVSSMLLASAAALSGQTAIPTSGGPAQSDHEVELHNLRTQLQAISNRLEQLEAETNSPSAPAPPPSSTTQIAPPAAKTETASINATDLPSLSFFRGTTLSFGIDGYYGYNFNAPVGRVNLLRAYDVTSNSFNLNQVNLVVEHLPTPESRFGGRIDLQFGQATETLQGSSANEQRPQVWRNLFQSYGSYLAPIGTGLQLDFGKFASSLGNEGNYSKDQILYSRAYSFNYLPFYHMGLRANYNVTPKVNFAYWLVNGANQTEDLNGFKSQAFLFTLRPVSSLTWNVNYYFGQEARDVLPSTNSSTTSAPIQPGLPTTNISPAPNGREHIFDTYATWQPTSKLTLIGEADYVLNRTVQEEQPGRVVIGSLTAKYALPNNWNLGARTEYFDDRGGLFSGTTQALKEATVSLDHTFAPGFIARAEYRRDWSNQRYFLSDTPGSLLNAQTTATLGLMYWWGTKQGSW